MLFRRRIETTYFKDIFSNMVVSTPALHQTQCGASVRSQSALATQPPEVNNYHCLLALALDRITVAITFMVNTKTSSTNAVPYWIWIGISGTCVEMTNK